MALLERDATRFAVSLEDYEHVSVTDIGGWGPIGHWVVVHDQRFEVDYVIASHGDYWDFIAALVDRKEIRRSCAGEALMVVEYLTPRNLRPEFL